MAEEEGARPALLPDLLITNLIPLDRAIPHPERRRKSSTTSRSRATTTRPPRSPRTPGRRRRKSKGEAFDLRVRALREPAAGGKATGPGEEYLKSTYFLDSAQRQGEGLATEAVGDETDPWRRRRRIEKWVHEHMKVSTAVDYVPASRTAADLRGDCRQHAMLTAAMCRAAKLPRGRRLGLVYDKDPEKGPMLAFHMWTEVWVKGQWMGIDAVWGEGGVGADHLKIADHAWADTQTLAPLAAVTRVMGKIKVEVAEGEIKGDLSEVAASPGEHALICRIPFSHSGEGLWLRGGHGHSPFFSCGGLSSKMGRLSLGIHGSDRRDADAVEVRA